MESDIFKGLLDQVRDGKLSGSEAQWSTSGSSWMGEVDHQKQVNGYITADTFIIYNKIPKWNSTEKKYEMDECLLENRQIIQVL